MIVALDKQSNDERAGQQNLISSHVIAVEAPTKKELSRLADELALDLGNLYDSIDPNEAPRLDYADEYNYLYLRVPRRVQKEGTPNTQTVLIVYNDYRLVLVSTEKMAPILTGRASYNNLVVEGSTATILIFILSKIIESYDFHIKDQTEAIGSIVKKMKNRSLENEDFVEFVFITDHISGFISALTPLIPLFSRLLTPIAEIKATKSEHDQLYDVSLAAQQSITTCEANARRISSIRDAYTTLSNNALNRTMKTLTAATLFIAAPNLIFSMYGMNVHLPLQKQDIGFLFAIGLSIIVLILIAIWARRRRLF